MLAICTTINNMPMHSWLLQSLNYAAVSMLEEYGGESLQNGQTVV